MKGVKIYSLCHPMVACINFLLPKQSPRSSSAFINLNFGVVQIGGDKADRVGLPPFFISDGMSVPGLLDGIIEPHEGIVAGHWHDFLYGASELSVAASDKMGDIFGAKPREAADEFMRLYLQKYSPGFSKLEAEASEAAVRFFGKRNFRNPKQDRWRAKLAKTTMTVGGNPTIPGGGCGHNPPAQNTEEARELAGYTANTIARVHALSCPK